MYAAEATDTHITVEKVIMDKTNKQIKLGDTLTVRNIGGTVGNVTMHTRGRGEQVSIFPWNLIHSLPYEDG